MVEMDLDVMEIIAELEPMIYTTKKTVADATGWETLQISKRAIQLNYIVAVSDGDV